MGRLTSGWTDRHVPVALALVLATLGGAVAMAEPPPHHLVALGLLVAVVLVALFLDAFGGAVVGLAAAVVLVGAEQLGGVWTPRVFATAVELVVVLLALGWLVGMASAGLRSSAHGGPEPTALGPAYGSLGLLEEDVALARLDEEVLRARHHRRPLTVAVFRLRLIDPTLDERARNSAERAVARLVESLLRETDVPFVLAPDEFGAVLPETDEAAAWEVVGPVLDAIGRATFTVREDDERRSLGECAEVSVGMAAPDDANSGAADLVARARAAARAEQVGTTTGRHQTRGPAA